MASRNGDEILMQPIRTASDPSTEIEDRPIDINSSDKTFSEANLIKWIWLATLQWRAKGSREVERVEPLTSRTR